MGFLIPTWEIAVDSKKHFRQAMIEALICRALSLGIKQERCDLFIRELSPSDLGLESWVIPKQEPKTTTTWINHQSSYDKVIGFHKVVQLSETPSIIELNIHLAKGSLYQHQLGQLYGLIPLLRRIKETGQLELLQVQYGLENLRMEGWFNEPYVISPSQMIKIDVTTGSKGAVDDSIVLVGFVAEAIKHSQ